MQHLMPRGRQGWIQQRRQRQHHHVALGANTPLPVAHRDLMDQQLSQVVAAQTQVPLQEAGTGRGGLPPSTRISTTGERH